MADLVAAEALTSLAREIAENQQVWARAKPPRLVGVSINRFGETELLHKDHEGITRRLRAPTPIVQAGRVINRLIAANVKRHRLARKWTLLDVANRLGIKDGNPKERIWAFENTGTRSHGMRLGTIYKLAVVFGVEARDLIPTNAEIAAALKTAEVR